MAGWLTRSAVAFGVVVATAAPVAASAATPRATCVDAGTTGLTTVVSAVSGQKIHGPIDATGCNLGVYVGPGVHNVLVSHTTITGSTDHGVFVEDAGHIRIDNNILRGDVTSPTTGIAEDKAIELVGTRRSQVAWNVITDTVGSGGIGLSDDGPIDPGAPNAGTLEPSMANLVLGNRILRSGTDCGIVVAAYNAGSGGVVRNTVQGNVVRTNVAGIVVAADSPDTVASGNSVVGNHIVGNFIPGVIVHSNAPDDVVSHTLIAQNVLSANGGDASAMGGAGPTDPTAIILAGEVEAITTTTIKNNSILSTEHFGIWIGNSTGTKITGLRLNHASVKVYEYGA